MDYPQKLAQVLSRRPTFDWDATNRATQYQAMADGAPVGAVGAAGGMVPFQTPTDAPMSFQDVMGAASFFPGVGDAAGLMGDAAMYATDPASRTPGNYALSAAGLLPFVPAASVTGKLAEALRVNPKMVDKLETYFHGSNDPNLLEITPKGAFGGVFASPQKMAAQSHGDYLYGIQSTNHLTDYELNYEIPHAWDAALEMTKGDEELANAIMNAEAPDASGWDGLEVQNLRGKLAKKLGYTSVEMTDEHGSSVLALPGSKIFRIDD